MDDRNLALEVVRVTEAAALASARLMGRGDKERADQVAVEAMRNAFNRIDVRGTVVIGEGERDEAPDWWAKYCWPMASTLPSQPSGRGASSASDATRSRGRSGAGTPMMRSGGGPPRPPPPMMIWSRGFLIPLLHIL